MRNGMMKKCLTLAMIATSLLLVNCGHDDDLRWYSEQEKLSNAIEKLEIDSIDPQQDWQMTNVLTANVTAALGLDETYTIAIYDNNPLFYDDVVYYAQTKVDDGATVTLTFDAPSADSVFYVALFDSKYRRLVQAARMHDKVLDVVFGEQPEAASRITRATESDADAAGYVKTLSDFLNPVYTKVNDWDQLPTVEAITLAEMKNYTAIDDNIVGTYFLQRNLQSPAYNNAGQPIHYGDHKHYRVPANVELRQAFSTSGSNAVNGLVLYIEGKVHLVGTNSLNDITLVVADGGEIILDAAENHFSGYGRFVVCPGGKITGIDNAAFNVNNGGWCYNAGTIDYQGTLNLNGSRFYNNNSVHVDILMGTSGGTHFTNFGHIKARTNAMQADAYNQNIVNGCYIQFTENAGVGGITMLKNSRLDVGGQLYITGNGLYGAARNEMHDASIIQAGSIKANAATFYGPTRGREAAIIKTGAVYANNDSDLKTAYNVYMDWNTHEFYYGYGAQIGADNSYMQGLVRNIGHWSSEDNSTITIPHGDCTGAGYHDTSALPDATVPGTPAVWTYAFEDTPLGDYDMNDVVIRASNHYDKDTKTMDDSKLDITLFCAGAALNLKVYLGQQVLFGGLEVHRFFGQREGALINTGLDPDVDFITVTMNKPQGFSFADADFWIDSPKVLGGVHIAKAGQDPHGIAVPADWNWPLEYVCIKDAYPNFVDFALDASTTDEAVKGWYKQTATNPVAGKVYTRK